LDVSLSFLVRFVLVLFKLCLVFGFHFFLHSGLIDFYSIFFFLENFLEGVAIVLPLVKLKLIFGLFFLGFTHFTKIFIQLRNLNICLLDLLLMLFINIVVLLLIILNCFCFGFFVFLFPSRNLLLKIDLLLHLLIILSSEINDDIISIFDLILVLTIKSLNFFMSKIVKVKSEKRK
jgi:hypothetical protein